MNRLLTNIPSSLLIRAFFACVILFSFSDGAQAQSGFLFVKKGAKKKRTYSEGDHIIFRLNGGTVLGGIITLLKNDTIYLSGRPIPRVMVEDVIVRTGKKERFQMDGKTIALTLLGAGLVTGGLTLSGQASAEEAAIAAGVMGGLPIALGFVKSKVRLGRKRFKIGKKFRLQVLDFHLPPVYRRPF